VLCLYPGNDFSIEFPDDAFGPDGRPVRDYFHKPSRFKHCLTWINLKSRLGSYLQKSLHVLALRTLRKVEQGPKLWWVDPELAARSTDTPAVRRSRALLAAIDEDCRRHGTRLCILVVGPVSTYFAKDGRSPLGRILADWKLDIPVIDYAVEVIARPNYPSLLFPRDGHLNESGHRALAEHVSEPLAVALGLSNDPRSR
jgi:hypothetical protein